MGGLFSSVCDRAGQRLLDGDGAVFVRRHRLGVVRRLSVPGIGGKLRMLVRVGGGGVIGLGGGKIGLRRGVAAVTFGVFGMAGAGSFIMVGDGGVPDGPRVQRIHAQQCQENDGNCEEPDRAD